MSYTYASFQSALALYMAIPHADVTTPNFIAALPSIIDYAEQRCYRELDLLAARADWFGALTPLDPSFQLSALSYPTLTNLPGPITIERARIFLPEGVAIPPVVSTIAKAVPCTPVAQEWLDAVYGPGATPGVPSWFAHTAQGLLEFGPPPDQAYTIALFGMYRPFPLYSAPPDDGSQMTFLSSLLPDLFLAAAMINASGYQKNFGSQADDPRMAQSWEQQFQSLLPTAKQEEMRKRFHGWQMNTAETPPPPQAPAAPPTG
jgi:hypothetical protein